jgi:hypothetical protein
LRNSFQDRAALADGLIGAQHHGEGAQHEHDGTPGGGFGEDVCRATRTEGRLAARAAESSGEVGGFAALEQDYDNQDKTIGNEKCRQQPEKPARVGQSPPQNDNSGADQQCNTPLHPTWHFENLTQDERWRD